MDRRGFLKLFATASIGVPVAQHMGLLEQLTSWVLGPKKTIFIPPQVSLARAWMSYGVSPMGFEQAVQWTKLTELMSERLTTDLDTVRKRILSINRMVDFKIPDIKQSSL